MELNSEFQHWEADASSFGFNLNTVPSLLPTPTLVPPTLLQRSIHVYPALHTATLPPAMPSSSFILSQASAEWLIPSGAPMEPTPLFPKSTLKWHTNNRFQSELQDDPVIGIQEKQQHQRNESEGIRKSRKRKVVRVTLCFHHLQC